MASNQQMHSQTYVNVHKILTELIPGLPEAILDKSYIRRGGKLNSVKQELADCKTLALANEAKLNKIIALLEGKQA